MRKRTNKLGSRLMALILICAVLVIGGLLAIVIVEIQNFNREYSVAHAQSSTLALQNEIDATEENALHFAQTVAGDMELEQALDSGDASALKQILANAAQETAVDFILVTDPNGTVLGSTLETYDLSGAKAQKAVSQSLAGEYYNTLDAGISSYFSAVTAMPVKSNGVIAGSLIMGIALNHEHIVDEIKEMQKDDVTIFLGDTRINTTIMKDGKRVVGTTVDPAVAERVLTLGESFSGLARFASFGGRGGRQRLAGRQHGFKPGRLEWEGGGRRRIGLAGGAERAGQEHRKSQSIQFH
jgi:methyl-accepting chemotaxis protein